MKRPTHVMVYDEETQAHEPMTLEDFAALFVPGMTMPRKGLPEPRLFVRDPEESPSGSNSNE